MKNHSSFNFYGINCRINSSENIFFSIMKEKFGLFNKDNIEFLVSNSDLLINFNCNTITKKVQFHLSDDTMITEKGIKFIHSYLGTKSQIEINFENEKLEEININFNSSLTIFFLDFITLGLFKKQIFSILIKIYIEQSLYYYLTQIKQLKVIHASAVEKNQTVVIFSGLNGVGKTTLAQSLISKFSYKSFSDNYVLIDKVNAYFSADPIRMSSSVTSIIGVIKKNDYGFGKKIMSLPNEKISTSKKLPIKTISLIIRGNKWDKRSISKKRFKELIDNLLIVNQEEISFSKLSQYYVFLGKLNNNPDLLPDCEYYLIEMGNVKDFNEANI